VNADPLPPGETDPGGPPRANVSAPEAALDSMRETRSRLVDSLQDLQRERAGDALESVLVEVDRTLGEMLAYVEDLRRTREQVVRGVESVADRLAEIDTRTLLSAAREAHLPAAGPETPPAAPPEAPTESDTPSPVEPFVAAAAPAAGSGAAPTETTAAPTHEPVDPPTVPEEVESPEIQFAPTEAAPPVERFVATAAPAAEPVEAARAPVEPSAATVSPPNDPDEVEVEEPPVEQFAATVSPPNVPDELEPPEGEFAPIRSVPPPVDAFATIVDPPAGRDEIEAEGPPVNPFAVAFDPPAIPDEVETSEGEDRTAESESPPVESFAATDDPPTVPDEIEAEETPVEPFAVASDPPTFSDEPQSSEGEDRTAESDSPPVEPSAEAPAPADPIDLVVHGCGTFELVGRLQEALTALPVVRGLRVRRFHRGSLYITVPVDGGALTAAMDGLFVDGRRLHIMESGDGRIEATFPAATEE
jgi:hypothetical protein